ncbi:transcriptional regulator [Heyndrickxia shackletonii]|uniref:Transcriptional regulator n=1 Tax=Heyndrickxia shackletonii TaxID=157838 RepID=A0A0Q3WUW4_9BACI|nr:GntR family transcriptional regulator [Heyndrickxia shackletonii]KQL53442.1 transcriptional regulator [Heyndrickxia shackletonii]MBB2481724.1 GntR family transcriptional regulator [Bacillus sp. APMAM]NEZ00015.1 GntR family transcriptional regulator [Heyndrickxia shackletonii]RTZ54914.1 GntR family transcriptional regulator [Bacillus sp. SAJ1]
MTQEFQTSKPIYMQIAERIFQQIVRGEMASGEKLASVREMAIQTGVNPNTIQRTYSEMERMGIVETRRGQGTFITENKVILTELKIRLQTDIIQSFVKSMKDIGFSKEEIVQGLQDYLNGCDEHD